MTSSRLTRLVGGIGLCALAFGFLLVLVALLLSGPALNTLAGGGLLLLFGNLAVSSTVAGLYLLDSSADQKGFGIRNLTPMGLGLLMFTANAIAVVVIGLIPEHLPLLSRPRLAAILVGLPVFLIGWFLLSLCGFRIWKKP